MAVTSFHREKNPLAKTTPRVYTHSVTIMSKEKKTPVNGKREKPRKKETTGSKDPEWEVLEERFSTMSEDFSKLADLMPRKEADE